MKKIQIKYNPYLIQTEILIDGKAPKPNSKLNFGDLRIQEWSSRLPQILVDECSDRNYEIYFDGTPTDFDDLKSAIESSDKISSSLNHSARPSASEVEKEVDTIFREIQAGPVNQLRDNSILEAFKKAKNQEFEINVVATMSSGKSTLINALIDKKLMPVANRATTATIVRIIDTDQENFSAIAYDSKGRKIKEDPNIIYRTMKDWNDDPSISAIDIYGKIPCVNSVGMRLVLVDTPGPNNSLDESHRQMTYKMLEDSDKSLVLFVMNGRQLNIDDQKNFMDYVYDCMQKGGKQSRERYIFAINQMDGFNPEDEEDPKDALDDAKKVLEDYKILSPNLFPVSSLAALEYRTQPKVQKVLPLFAPLVAEYPEMKFDSYYDYNNLPLSIKKHIEGLLKGLTPTEALEVHSGIVSIEEAIGLYIDKYARAQKVKDLVDAFNNRLNELNAVETLKESIRKNQDLKVKLDEKIANIQSIVESGKSAQTLSRLIDRKNLSRSVTLEIDEYVDQTKTKIERLIFRHSNSTQVEKDEALRQVKSVKKESDDLLNQLDARIATILERGYKALMEDILDEYKGYLSELGIDAEADSFALRPLDFVAENLNDINSLISHNTEVKDEGGYETRTVKESYPHKLKNSFWTPWHWFSDRYETRYRDRKVTEWVRNDKVYVNMANVVSEYLEPLQEQLIAAKAAASEHADSESNRIKKDVKAFLAKINKVLSDKLQELKSVTEESSQTQEEIEMQESNLKWMRGMIERVNKLVNF